MSYKIEPLIKDPINKALTLESNLDFTLYSLLKGLTLSLPKDSKALDTLERLIEVLRIVSFKQAYNKFI